MTKELVTSQSFEERLKNRIKDSFGELMTDEELTELIRRGVDEIFFKPRKGQPKRYPYDHENEEKEPLIHELIKDTVLPAAKDTLREFMRDNQEMIVQIIQEEIGEAGEGILKRAVKSIFEDAFNDLSMNIQSRIQSFV